MNTDQQPTIKDFLLARIAEDEVQARAAAPWATGSRHEGQPIDWSIHFDRWSPARVLAECAAKRAVLEMQAANDEDRHKPGFHYKAQMIEGILRTLAAIHSAHPDYRPQWAPRG